MLWYAMLCSGSVNERCMAWHGMGHDNGQEEKREALDASRDVRSTFYLLPSTPYPVKRARRAEKQRKRAPLYFPLRLAVTRHKRRAVLLSIFVAMQRTKPP